MRNLCFFCLFLTKCFCSYPYRDIRRPIIKLYDNSQIFSLSTRRSGSTLIYNILNYLFEDKSYLYNHRNRKYRIRVKKSYKLKTNTFIPGQTVYIFQTIREPLNILASAKKVRYPIGDELSDPTE